MGTSGVGARVTCGTCNGGGKGGSIGAFELAGIIKSGGGGGGGNTRPLLGGGLGGVVTDVFVADVNVGAVVLLTGSDAFRDVPHV